MADTVIATFDGPLDGFAINLTITNDADGEIRAFGISGRTARFPMTWDSFGAFSGPATLGTVTGVDTEVIMARFTNFGSGDTIRFTSVDPDFTGDNVSSVRVLDLEGCKTTVLFSDGTTAFGCFEVTTDAELRAVMVK